MEKFGGDIGNKYANIDQRGRRAVDLGEIELFRGASEQLKERFNFSLFFSSSSTESLKRVVLDEIESLSGRLGINLFLTGRDFPAHVTILEGTPTFMENKAENEVALDQIFDDLKNNAELKKKLSNMLVGKTVEFKYILIDRGNLILTCVDIPEFIIEARKLISDAYSTSHIKPLEIKNILHITLSRIVSIPENPEILNRYKEEIIKLRHIVSKNPLSLTFGSVESGRSYDLLTKSN